MIKVKTFFVGLADKLLIIKEQKNEYIISTQLTGKKINRLAVVPQNPMQLYAATAAHGLWRSFDGGEHWERVGVNRGLESSTITSVAVNPIKKENGKSIVYAGTEPSHLYYSEDGGDHWLEFKEIQKMSSKKNWSFPPLPETHYVRWITPSYTNAEHLAISIEAGAVLHTTTHGKTWKDRPKESPIDVHTLLAHPKKPGYLYAANGDGGSTQEKAYAESPDGGKSWRYKSEGLEKHPYLYNMVINSENPEEILVSASLNASRAHRTPRYSTIYHKIENNNWTELSDGLPKEGAYTHHLAEDPHMPGAYYVLNNFGLYYLPVEEDRWQKINVDAKENGFAQRAYAFLVQ